jgi:hypothetical protein
MKNHTLRLVVFGVLSALFVVSLVFLGYGNFTSGMPLGEVLLSSLILAIPLVLLYFGIGLIVEAWQQHRQGQVSARMAKFLYLAPRIAGIVIALFVELFSLDAFETPGNIWMKIGAFLIHSAPSIIVLVLMVLAWRWAWVGTLVFGLVGAFIFIMTVIPRSFMGIGNLLLFVLPMAVVAILFWLNWRWRGEISNI